MKVKFSQKDREALSESIKSFGNEKLKDIISFTGGTDVGGWSKSKWKRSVDDITAG